MKYLVRNGTAKAAAYNYQEHIQKAIKPNMEGKIFGLSEEKVLNLRESFGIGTMVIEQPTIPVLFAREIVQPLYIFIIVSIIIWLFDNYQIYCAVIFFTLAFGVILNLYETYKSNKKIN